MLARNRKLSLIRSRRERLWERFIHCVDSSREDIVYLLTSVCCEESFHFLFPPSLKIGSPTFSAIMEIILRRLLMCYVKQRIVGRYSRMPINIFEKRSIVPSKETYGQSHNAASICVVFFFITYFLLAQNSSASCCDAELRHS